METKRIIAEREREEIGGSPKVFRYWDDSESSHIDVLSSADRPCRGAVSYATIGLSEYDVGLIADGKRLGIELLGVCGAGEKSFANMLASAAFAVIKSGKCSYGDIIPDVIAGYRNDTDMKHFFLTNPFLWDGFGTLESEDRLTAWLLAVPISNSEKDYADENGWEALEDRFEECGIDILDLERKPIFE